jgi:hypothetical protein
MWQKNKVMESRTKLGGGLNLYFYTYLVIGNYGHFVYFMVFWYIFPILVCLGREKIWQPWPRVRADMRNERKIRGMSTFLRIMQNEGKTKRESRNDKWQRMSRLSKIAFFNSPAG